MSWNVTPAQPGHGLVIRYSEPGHEDEVFALPIIAWRTDDSGYGEAIVMTQTDVNPESDLRNVTNWTVLGYHIPPLMPHPDMPS